MTKEVKVWKQEFEVTGHLAQDLCKTAPPAGDQLKHIYAPVGEPFTFNHKRPPTQTHPQPLGCCARQYSDTSWVRDSSKAWPDPEAPPWSYLLFSSFWNSFQSYLWGVLKHLLKFYWSCTPSFSPASLPFVQMPFDPKVSAGQPYHRCPRFLGSLHDHKRHPPSRTYKMERFVWPHSFGDYDPKLGSIPLLPVVRQHVLAWKT